HARNRYSEHAIAGRDPRRTLRPHHRGDRPSHGRAARDRRPKADRLREPGPHRSLLIYFGDPGSGARTGVVVPQPWSLADFMSLINWSGSLLLIFGFSAWLASVQP